MAITIFYITTKGCQTTKVYVPNNKNIVELKAILNKRIPFIKGKIFDINNNKDIIADDIMFHTKVQDGGGLGVSLQSGGPIDVDDEEIEAAGAERWQRNGRVLLP